MCDVNTLQTTTLPTKLTSTPSQKKLGIFNVITVLSLKFSNPSRHVPISYIQVTNITRSLTDLHQCEQIAITCILNKESQNDDT